MYIISYTLIFSATKFLALINAVSESVIPLSGPPCVLPDTIRRNIDQGRLNGAVFIDLRKALDTINYEALLNKLRGLGVMHREHEWFRNYLNDRT